MIPFSELRQHAKEHGFIAGYNRQANEYSIIKDTIIYRSDNTEDLLQVIDNYTPIERVRINHN